ncbi:MAG: bifunctional phosphoribosyl-AMP cyclohydrolase/phosphoribosyl-ATP diphosphatase [Gammaproteobacteria bacterium]|jgi:phosphoribosyl-ATP pyrophosphohydrolase/phosphoribosyl-AMP cyclohydrolase|nr:bifunctional phosphoribosyl-AMP cyclohydrolase/phosphoribosyl-ATP diphosphatase [Gammaproteobacteria bacterium]
MSHKKPLNIETLAFDKGDGLLPAIIQHAITLEVLMLGYMNKEALTQTLSTKRVTFYSRSRQALWIKGETSQNYLNLQDIVQDCDNDSLLIYALPEGPTCHTGETSCFNGNDMPSPAHLLNLRQIVMDRKNHPQENSYTTTLLQGKLSRIAQKVGEEGVEVALAAVCENQQSLAEESVDLLYHLFVLLEAREVTLDDLSQVIKARRR